MEEIGLRDQGVSPVAVSEPFSLFSEDAVNIMRDEILSPVVMDNYAWTSDIAPKQLRGYAPKHGKFTYSAWNDPQVLSIISKVAGVDLVPQSDLEIAHINLSVPGKLKKHSGDDEDAIVGWHKDSYPFVCVLMMSDTTGMQGGETVLQTGFGTKIEVKSPSKGCCVVLQGRYITHLAKRAFGGQERITAVTSFRPKSPFVRDDTVLRTVIPVSNLSELYGQTVEYQLENAQIRMRAMLEKVKNNMKDGKVDTASIKDFLDFEARQFAHLNKEIVDESKVVQGSVAEVALEEKKMVDERNGEPKLVVDTLEDSSDDEEKAEYQESYYQDYSPRLVEPSRA